MKREVDALTSYSRSKANSIYSVEKGDELSHIHSKLSQTIKSDYFSRASCTNSNSNCVLIKLIGNKNDNIQEILKGISCYCGANQSFRNVLSIIIDKVYRLREQRNYYKMELQRLNLLMTDTSSQIETKDIGINTYDEVERQEILKKLIDDSQDQIYYQENQKNLALINYISEELNKESLFQYDLSESNLLEQTNRQRPSFPIQFQLTQSNIDNEQQKSFALRENCYRGQNKFNEFRQINQVIKGKNVKFNELDRYIQKKNCRKEIDKQNIKRRCKQIL